MHRQYTTHIKQDAVITKLGDIWLHVSAVTGHLRTTIKVVLSWPEDGRSRQYTIHIKQDAIITKLGDIWLHVSALTGHLQPN